MQSFNSAFDILSSNNENRNLVNGENGALAFASVGKDIDAMLLELFTTMRGEDSNMVINRVKVILEQYVGKFDLQRITENVSNVLKLTLLIIAIRDPRQGKGEKDILYTIMEYYWTQMPNTTKTLLPLLGSFGYWKDLVNLWNKTTHDDFKREIVQCYSKQLLKDIESVNKDPNVPISLAGKWAPSEGKQFEKMAFKLAKAMKNTIPMYRHNISLLRTHNNVVETLMCKKSFSSINPEKVPSVAVSNYRSAFLDEKANERRHKESDPDYVDRNACRENFLKHISSGGKINSSVNELHTIVTAYFNGEELNPIMEAQWKARVDEIRKSNIKLPRIFPMSDLSGSMDGIPMMVSITLGIFTSELLDNESETEPEFANRFLTFDTKPQLVKLPRGASLYEKVKVMKKWCDSGCWGGNTNITSAIQKLLDVAIRAQLTQEQMCEVLVIFSDMQFDVADSSWAKESTSYELMVKQFEQANYTVPHVLFWNLRAKTVGFQVEANTMNTSMVSGYSSKMMNLFLTNSMDTLQTSPVSLMLAAINNPTYKPCIPSLERAICMDLTRN